MSLQELERFAADLKSNAALRAEAEKAQTEEADGALLARAVSFAVRKGYRFTVDEAKAHTKARARAVGKELGDAELDGPSGGPCWYWSILLVGSYGQSDFDHGRYWSVGPLRS
jgi:Nif11 domain